MVGSVVSGVVVGMVDLIILEVWFQERLQKEKLHSY